MGEPLPVWNSIPVMTNRENTWVIQKSLFNQDVKSPEAVFNKWKTCGPETAYARPYWIFYNWFCFSYIHAELIRRHFICQPVSITVTCNFMSLFMNISNKRRISFRNPPENKKSGLDFIAIQDFKNSHHISLYSWRHIVPFTAAQVRLKGRNVIIVLDIHCQSIQHLLPPVTFIVCNMEQFLHN